MDIPISHSINEQTRSAWVENPCHGDATRFVPAARPIGPPIEPVAGGLPRPLWSVMIPAYNCADYLRHTLRGVLDQDPGPDRMQIQVVDDCSTKDDPAAVVREMGGGRIRYFRQPKNIRAIESVHTCGRPARRPPGHIL